MLEEYALFTIRPINVVREHVDLDLPTVGNVTEIIEEGSDCLSFRSCTIALGKLQLN